jgi:peroxiredoxin
MVKTASTMRQLGTPAPDFSLMNVDGTIISKIDFEDQPGLLVIFMCNHCPFVKHVAAELTRLAHDYMPKGIAIVGINSNDTSTNPEDSPEQMVHEAEQRGYPFPYLFDEDQDIAQAYHASCTPDFFLFDGQQKLYYRGQLDPSRPKAGDVADGRDLRAALDALLAGKPAPEKQIPSIGCNIKWRAGNEPAYFDAAGVKG